MAEMMIRPATLAMLFALSAPLTAGTEALRPAEITLHSMAQIDHPVSTTNKAAQDRFNEGLTYIFAFNHDLAFTEFEKAVQLDPDLAMGYWGMALSLGQNINRDVTKENEIKAYGYVQQALKLSSKASKNEQAYIRALVARYTNDPSADLIPLRSKYREAMKEVVSTYAEDLDAACLYSESILNLTPWDYWTSDGKPTSSGTTEAIEILAAVLRRNPDHIGANHYYIHAWEASPTPERALLSAYRLTALLPASGHLLHMPCHIFVLVGDYQSAIKTSLNAIQADQNYIQQYGLNGEYPLHYLSHNIFILSRAYMFAEDYDKAFKTALSLVDFLGPHLDKMPNMAPMTLLPLEINLYFHRWQELLTYQLPAVTTPYMKTFFHFAKAVAYTYLGDFASAQKETALMIKEKQNVSDKELIAKNPAPKVLSVAELVLKAALAEAQKQPAQQIAYLTEAAAIQARFNYDEPPSWYIPLQIPLGKALLEQKRFSEAAQVFEMALSKLQRNGRLLYGLTLGLKGQGLTWNAFWTERETKAALKQASAPLTLDNL